MFLFKIIAFSGAKVSIKLRRDFETTGFFISDTLTSRGIIRFSNFTTKSTSAPVVVLQKKGFR
jgi:hypothetical protein